MFNFRKEGSRSRGSSFEPKRGPTVEVHLFAPLFLSGGSNEVHAVRGQLLGEGEVGLTVLVTEDGTVDSGTLRFFPSLMALRVLSLPWGSIFCVARSDEVGE